MAEMWRPQPNEVLRQWVDAIIDEASDQLTSWETSFINDMQIRIYNGWSLTETQEKKLESIYADKTS